MTASWATLRSDCPRRLIAKSKFALDLSSCWHDIFSPITTSVPGSILDIPQNIPEQGLGTLILSCACSADFQYFLSLCWLDKQNGLPHGMETTLVNTVQLATVTHTVKLFEDGIQVYIGVVPSRTTEGNLVGFFGVVSLVFTIRFSLSICQIP
jgi:hypothetical protein